MVKTDPMLMESIPTPKPELTRRRKAAMIVHLLLNDGGKLGLSGLPEKVQRDLAQELGEIRLVDRETIKAVAQEFVEILESIGLSAPGGKRAALEALSAHISPTLAKRLQAELDGETGSDPWPRIIGLEDDQLIVMLQSESVQVAAVVMSKLPTERAAEILAKLPGDKARRITLAISRTEDTSIAALQRIGEGLVKDYCQITVKAFDKPPVNLLGDILNSTASETREDVLEGLDSTDEELARNVRKNIFTFENIPERLSIADIPTALRAVDPDELKYAIGYALFAGGEITDAAEHILGNISKRMAGMIREEAKELGTVSQKAGEAAMNKVTNAIRMLADEGTIKLIVKDGEAEDG